MNRPIDPRHPLEIWAQWDRLAETRMDQIESGSDITYNQVLLPAILDIVGNLRPSSIIDVGCGVGILTHKLSNYAEFVVGVDPSKNSIGIAEARWKECLFLQVTAEDFARLWSYEFDLVVSNMVLMDAPNLSEFMSACASMIKPGGLFVFSLTHPFFWPKYYGYDGEDWFRYEAEVAIEGPFRISKDQNGKIPSIHFHRPLSRYLNEFSAAGLNLEKFEEVMPAPEIEALYEKPWKYPRYIVGYCRKL